LFHGLNVPLLGQKIREGSVPPAILIFIAVYIYFYFILPRFRIIYKFAQGVNKLKKRKWWTRGLIIPFLGTHNSTCIHSFFLGAEPAFSTHRVLQ